MRSGHWLYLDKIFPTHDRYERINMPGTLHVILTEGEADPDGERGADLEVE